MTEDYKAVRPAELIPFPARRERDDPADSDARAGGASPITIELTCADCGTRWSITPFDILAGDDWIRCPNCSRAAS